MAIKAAGKDRKGLQPARKRRYHPRGLLNVSRARPEDDHLAVRFKLFTRMGLSKRKVPSDQSRSARLSGKRGEPLHLNGYEAKERVARLEDCSCCLHPRLVAQGGAKEKTERGGNRGKGGWQGKCRTIYPRLTSIGSYQAWGDRVIKWQGKGEEMGIRASLLGNAYKKAS